MRVGCQPRQQCVQSVDAVRFSADRRGATQSREWLDTGTGAFLDVTARYNVLLSAAPVNGAVVSVHVGAIPYADSAIPWKLIVATGRWSWQAKSPQLGTVVLHGARRDNSLALVPVPERLTLAARGTPPGKAANVRQMYALFAQTISEGPTVQPTFETAVDLPSLIDAIRLASEDVRR